MPRHIKRKYGFDAWYYAIQFDTAIVAAGSHIENKLNNFEDKRPANVILHELLHPRPRGEKIIPFEGLQVTRMSRQMVNSKPKFVGGGKHG